MIIIIEADCHTLFLPRFVL